MRVRQEREFERVGAAETKNVDVRQIPATVVEQIGQLLCAAKTRVEGRSCETSKSCPDVQTVNPVPTSPGREQTKLKTLTLRNGYAS